MGVIPSVAQVKAAASPRFILTVKLEIRRNAVSRRDRDLLRVLRMHPVGGLLGLAGGNEDRAWIVVQGVEPGFAVTRHTWVVGYAASG